MSEAFFEGDWELRIIVPIVLNNLYFETQMSNASRQFSNLGGSTTSKLDQNPESNGLSRVESSQVGQSLVKSVFYGSILALHKSRKISTCAMTKFLVLSPKNLQKSTVLVAGHLDRNYLQKQQTHF